MPHREKEVHPGSRPSPQNKFSTMPVGDVRDARVTSLLPFLFSFITFSTEVAIQGETISKDQFLFITRTDYAILACDRGLEGIAKPEKLEPWPLR